MSQASEQWLKVSAVPQRARLQNVDSAKMTECLEAPITLLSPS